jgi:hypothetical protein
MVLDSSSLTVERVVDDPGILGLGTVETTLDSRANRSGTLGETKDTALGEHNG